MFKKVYLLAENSFSLKLTDRHSYFKRLEFYYKNRIRKSNVAQISEILRSKQKEIID